MDFTRFDYTVSFGTGDQLRPSDRPEIVFSGRSNVGKSSLLNALCGRKNLARVSSTPGKTTTINFFENGEVVFADLPGYGFARRSFEEKKRWGELMERYFTSNRNIRLVVQLVDGRRAPTEDDYDMMDYMYEAGIPFLVVLTKWDKLNKGEQAKRLADVARELSDYGDPAAIPFSALKGTGTDAVRAAIEGYLS